MNGIFVGLALLFGAALGWSAVAVLVGVFIVAMTLHWRTNLWTIALVAAAIAGSWRVHDRPAITVPDWTAEQTLFIGRVVRGPVETGRAQRFELTTWPDDGIAHAVSSVKLCATAAVLPSLVFGDVISASGSIRTLEQVDRQTAGYLRSVGCAGTFTIGQMSVVTPGHGLRSDLDRVRRRMTDALQGAFPGESGALMAGLVTGDDAGLSDRQRSAFIVTGTSHTTAVSGSNLAVIVAILAMFGGLAQIARQLMWQVAVVALLWGYVLVIGISPPPARAAMVATLAFVATRLGRRPDFVTISVATAGIELLIWPSHFDTLSYQLSTISALALILGLAGRSSNGMRNKLIYGIVATSVTQAATSPLLVPTFGRFTIFAVPANLIVGALCTFAFPFLLVAGLIGLLSQTAATLIATPAAVPVLISLWTVREISGLPFARSGSSLAIMTPEWIWIGLALTVVISLSSECRNGLRRAGSEFALLDRPALAVLSCASTGAMIGLVVGLWAR
jgi:ComEC/Rec2-related protein